jgi:hypothetical protein
MRDNFFGPVSGMAESSHHARACPELPDADWLKLGVTRVVSDPTSGRGFLQQTGVSIVNCPGHSLFFETLKSSRRLGMLKDVNHRLSVAMKPATDMPNLFKDYALFAADGHWHAAATHDAQIDEKRWAVGHLYAYDMRSEALHHITTTEGKKEHDMHALKRSGAEQLRLCVKKARKVLLVWDRAGIDFRLWHNWKHQSGIYFISRTKENMKLEVIAQKPFDASDSINHGVLADELVSTSQNVTVRRVGYQEPVTGKIFEYMTTVMDLAPGAIAWLYKRRWEIEKVFDQLKNKFDETKAWASSSNAKAMQATFLCLAHNLTVLFERGLDEEGVDDVAGRKRQESRLQKEVSLTTKLLRPMSSLLTKVIRPLVRSVKLIRWFRAHWFSSSPLRDLLGHLRGVYATL